MTAAPFASIIVPTYNQEAYLSQALDSLLSQTDPDWEAIVVNDGSTDRTAEIAEDYARRDPRVRCIHKPNGGVASALNVGLANARGEWAHWLSSDDMFEPDKLSINRAWSRRHPDCNFFFSYFTLLREVTGARERRDLWGPLPSAGHEILTLFYRNYISGISVCIRRSVWEEVGFFDETLYYAQDYGQWLRLLHRTPAMFIPEWMVISRNHSAQGSETFPDACYFDTAKAAIEFINGHGFPELVPWVDLGDRSEAAKAVSYALDVACDRSAFLYCLGPNPALVFRVIEWVWSDRCGDAGLRALVRSRIAGMSFSDGGDDWSWMWRQLAALVHGGEDFSYSPTDPVQLALRLYQSRRIDGDTPVTALRGYLQRFQAIDPDEALPSAEKNQRIVFLLDRLPANASLVAAADRLARHGFRVLLIGRAKAGEGAPPWRDWVPAIRTETPDRDFLPWLGEVELAVGAVGGNAPVWLGATAFLALPDGVGAEDMVGSILDSSREGAEQPRPVVFLERVLWGGGAERVVLDIVRHLDRRKYRPVLLTMFEEHTKGPDWPADVEFSNVRREALGPVCQTATAHSGGGQADGLAARLVRKARRVYHRLLPGDFRQRVGLGRGLSALRNSLARARTSAMVATAAPRRPGPSGSPPSASDVEFDFIEAMAHHNSSAIGVARAMDRLGPDAVLVSIMEEAAVAAWLAQAAGRFPQVVSLHTLESVCLPMIFPRPPRLAAERFLLSAACAQADVVVMPSSGCCRDLAENFELADAKAQRIFNPVDCASVRRMSFQPFEAAERWRRISGFRLVHVGRLDTQKNHDLLLLACAELKRRQRRFSLAIVGEGPDRPNIEKRIRALGLGEEVTLVGELKNPFP